MFASLTVPCKRLLLASWTGPEAAGAFRPTETDRHRTVRVIRDHALRDRRATPQYVPDPPPVAAA